MTRATQGRARVGRGLSHPLTPAAAIFAAAAVRATLHETAGQWWVLCGWAVMALAAGYSLSGSV